MDGIDDTTRAVEQVERRRDIPGTVGAEHGQQAAVGYFVLSVEDGVVKAVGEQIAVERELAFALAVIGAVHGKAGALAQGERAG